MSEYLLPLNDFNSCRVTGYKFTVKSKSDPDLLNLKKNVRIANASAKHLLIEYNKKGYQPFPLKLYRVSLYARGPRRWSTWLAHNHPELTGKPEKYIAEKLLQYKNEMLNDYDPKHIKSLHYNADCNLRHKFATRFDVYVHRNQQAESKWYRKFETGLTYSEQQKVDRLQVEIQSIEIQAKRRKLYNDNTK